MRSTDKLTPRGYMVIATIAAALFLFGIPQLHGVIRSQRVEVVQTYVLAVICPRAPVQHEQLVVLDDGAGGGRCMYVRARGAYGVTR